MPESTPPASRVPTRPFAYQHGVLTIDGLPLPPLADRFGTPLYVYSAANLRHRLDLFTQAFAATPHTICYAVKASSSLALLQLLGSRGAGFDIVSGGELERVRRACPSALKRVVFSGTGKQAWEIDAALHANILLFNVESAQELDLLAARAAAFGKQARFALRVNPDVFAETHPYISTGLREHKFGIDISFARDLYRHAASLPSLLATGVSVHIGSQIQAITPFAQALTRVATLIRDLRADGHPITHIDLGGGLGIDYLAPLAPDDTAPPAPNLATPDLATADFATANLAVADLATAELDTAEKRSTPAIFGCHSDPELVEGEEPPHLLFATEQSDAQQNHPPSPTPVTSTEEHSTLAAVISTEGEAAAERPPHLPFATEQSDAQQNHPPSPTPVTSTEEHSTLAAVISTEGEAAAERPPHLLFATEQSDAQQTSSQHSVIPTEDAAQRSRSGGTRFSAEPPTEPESQTHGEPSSIAPPALTPEAQVAAYAAALLPTLATLNCHLLLEPGRFLIAQAGALLTRVLGTKQNGAKRFVITDAAMNDLIRPALYQAHHEILPVLPSAPAPATDLSSRPDPERATRVEGGVEGPASPTSPMPPLEAVDIVGPVCESGDFFAHDRPLPPLSPGDLLLLLDAGAYGMSQASNYNTRPRPAELLIDQSRAHLIRRRETLDDLLAPEILL